MGNAQIKIFNYNSYLLHVEAHDSLQSQKLVFLGTLPPNTPSRIFPVSLNGGNYSLHLVWYPVPQGQNPFTADISASANQNIKIQDDKVTPLDPPLEAGASTAAAPPH